MLDKGAVGGGSEAGNKDAGSNIATSIKVEVDGKEQEFNQEDVKNLLGARATMTKATQTLAEVQKVTGRYQTDIPTYMKQAEAALSVVSDLITEGVLDDQGKLIKKGKGKAEGDGMDDDFLTLEAGKGTGATPEVNLGSVEAIVEKALGAKETAMNERLTRMENAQVMLYQNNLKIELRKAQPTLSEGDLDRVFTIAEQKPDVTLPTIAKALAESKAKSMGEIRAQHAKEFDIDLDEFDKRKEIDSLDPEGGVLGQFKDKKFSFKKQAVRKGEDDTVNPFDAMTAHFAKLDGR